MSNSTTGTTRLEKIEFYEARIAPWTANTAAIGLSPSMVTEIGNRTTAARAAYNAAIAARNASKAATEAYHNAADAMAEYGSGLVSTIRAKAQNTGNPNVYVLAQVPPKAPPTPAGPPTDAENVVSTVMNDGSIRLDWEGTVRGGQFFSVRRQIAGSPVWETLGSVRVKSFLDASLPQGSGSVVYQVFAHRGDLVSQGSEPVVVFFGTEPGESDEPQLKVA